MALQQATLIEFQRFKATRCKLSYHLIVEIAREILRSGELGIFDQNYRDRANKKIIEKVHYQWAISFAEKHNIVIRHRKGKHSVSPEKQAEIEKGVVRFLALLKKAFEQGELDQKTLSNMDETHFIIDMDDKKSLGFVGDEEVRYAKIVSGGEGMTMVVHISGGPEGKVETPMIIFQNASSNYPIRNLPDEVPGVCYRTGPKGWMDKSRFAEWMEEDRILQPIDVIRTIAVDNCGGHGPKGHTERIAMAIKNKKVRLLYLPPNATHLVQAVDSFIIKKLKQLWMAAWNRKNFELIRAEEYQNASRGASSGSGKLKNPGKSFFF